MSDVAKLSQDTLHEQLLLTVVKIISIKSNGEASTGTGFFYKLDFDKTSNIQVIITNKHVLNGCAKLKFSFHKSTEDAKKASGEFYEVIEDNPWRMIVYHPSIDVDLAAIFLQPLSEIFFQKAKEKLYNISLTKENIPTENDLLNLKAMEEVIMVGFPLGLSDDVNNLPLLRKGVTASHPAINFQGKKDFVIDMACFPGSSGSPVMIAHQGSFTDKHGSLSLGGSKFFLLGVLHSGPQMNAQGKIEIRNIPMVQVPVSVTQLMIHLGYVHKSILIAELEQQIKTVATMSLDQLKKYNQKLLNYIL